MLAKLLIFLLLIGLVAPDIVRPCAFSNLPCIGRILALNSRCNPNVIGSIPPRYTVQRLPFFAPYFNATYIDQNLAISNHNRCRVSEFFVNRNTNTVVLALDCPNLDFESDRLTIQHNSLQEDKHYSYKIQGTYPLIRLTTNLHTTDRMNLCTARTFADVTVLPKFRLRPNDKRTADYLSRDLTLLNIFERECFFWRSSLLARYFINSFICNYGCNS